MVSKTGREGVICVLKPSMSSIGTVNWIMDALASAIYFIIKSL